MSRRSAAVRGEPEHRFEGDVGAQGLGHRPNTDAEDLSKSTRQRIVVGNRDPNFQTGLTDAEARVALSGLPATRHETRQHRSSVTPAECGRATLGAGPVASR